MAIAKSGPVKLEDGIAIARESARMAWERANVPMVDFEETPHIFESHVGQMEAWNAVEHVVAVFAGWQSGKSVAGPPWLLREMQRMGPGDYAVLAPTYPLLRKKALPELLRFLRSKLKEGEDFVLKAADMELHILPPGGSKIWDGGGTACIYLVNANNPQAVEAFTAKSIWIDEPGQIPDETWESVQARVAVNEGRIFLTSRPYDHNWYVREIWNKRETDPRIRVVNFSSKDNPAFPDEEYYRQKALLPWWKHRMKYDGIPTKPAGAIYECFEDEYTDGDGTPTGSRILETLYFGAKIEIEMLGRNVCKRFDIPDQWKRPTGHDFGQKNTAAVFAARDPYTKKVFVYRAYHSGDKTIAEHVEQYRGRRASKMPVQAFGGAISEEKIRIDYAKHGWPISLPPITDVDEGITRVFSLIKTGVLVVFADLDKLIQDLLNYSWELDDNGEPIEGKIDKKETWHRLDALRYLCAAIYEGYAQDWETVERFAECEDPETAQQRFATIDEYEYKHPEELEQEPLNAFAHLGWE
jgi:hypothetical protein